MTTDITSANVKNLGATNQITGRSHELWGTREVGLWRVSFTSSHPGAGITFDPKTYGFQGVVGAVFFAPHFLVGSNAVARYIPAYDHVNKKIFVADITDAFDNADGDDLSLLIVDVIVVSE